MGKRGPQKTPTNILKLRGSWRADARVDEPEPSKKRPSCPNYISKYGKTVWRWLIPQLEQMGILGECDKNAIARYCQMVSQWRDATIAINEQTETMYPKSANGQLAEINITGAFRTQQKLSEQLCKLEREFGLTPASRAGLAKEKNNPDENRGRYERKTKNITEFMTG